MLGGLGLMVMPLNKGDVQNCDHNNLSFMPLYTRHNISDIADGMAATRNIRSSVGNSTSYKDKQAIL